VSEAKQDWQVQWNGERKRLTAEIERLKKMDPAGDRRETARRAVLERLGKLSSGSAGTAVKSDGQLEREFQDAKIQWETERDQLNLKINKLEMELQREADTIRSEIFQEMRTQYEPKLEDAKNERQRLELEFQSISGELANDRRRLNARVQQLEQAIPEAQEAARKQAAAEIQSQFDIYAEEATRLRLRAERKQQEMIDEWESERRSGQKQIAVLEEQLKQAKAAAFKPQKSS
jgi:hypothetical protein